MDCSTINYAKMLVGRGLLSSPNFDIDSTKGPLMLGCQREQAHKIGPFRDWHDLPRHKDEDQVHLDVNRAFVYYPKSRSVVST